MSGGSDGGAGADADNPDDGVGCTPYAARAAAPELFIGPTGLQSKLLSEIGSAQDELLIMMYLLTVDEFVSAIVAAKSRGVAVRVILDRDHDGNIDARSALTAASVEWRDSPAGFMHAHTKAMIIDGRAIIMSSNLNYSSMTSERNYGVVDRDPEDVADLRAVFEADWADDGSYPNLDCTRLLVSPVNARARVLGHINRATQSLDLSVLYAVDDTVRAALINRHNVGIDVRVLLADPREFSENYTAAEQLGNAGIEVKFLQSVDLHAKLVLSDGMPLVGSHNMSFTSLTQNREIGVVITNETAAAAARAQFAQDWAAGVTP
jgi:phosphatidylserine/phosphatidylglycerophosphate/cardiolipin synthase-like enzyme